MVKQNAYLEQRLDDVEAEVGRISRSYDSFRPYVNKNITYIRDTLERLEATITRIDATMATKDDLKDLATHTDNRFVSLEVRLDGMATKEDLNGFATKDDLESFATKDDIKVILAKLDTMQAHPI